MHIKVEKNKYFKLNEVNENLERIQQKKRKEQFKEQIL